MPWRGDELVGRITLDVELANYRDLMLSEEARLPPEQVRRIRIAGVIDSGAARLVLPAATVAALGLPESGEANVRYADHHTAVRPVVRDVWLTLLGRQGVFTAVVEPNRTSALIGAIVLEELDLVVDCSRQTLHPRDPDRIVSEIE
ncbi:MAG TPA: hypothetical protein VGM03_09605 [Phycisphaerae bacterium]|jgi:predicted aspartyl protease